MVKKVKTVKRDKAQGKNLLDYAVLSRNLSRQIKRELVEDAKTNPNSVR